MTFRRPSLLHGSSKSLTTAVCWPALVVPWPVLPRPVFVELPLRRWRSGQCTIPRVAARQPRAASRLHSHPRPALQHRQCPPPITATAGEQAQQAGKVSSLEELLAQAQRSSLGSGLSATVGGAATSPPAREKPNRSPGKPSPSTNAGGSGISGKKAPMAVAPKTGKVGNIWPEMKEELIGIIEKLLADRSLCLLSLNSYNNKSCHVGKIFTGIFIVRTKHFFFSLLPSRSFLNEFHSAYSNVL